MDSGAIWGNTVAGLGQAIGGAVQQYGQQKEIAKRDATWLQYVQSGEWQKDPKAAYTASKAIWGPDGDKQFQSLMGVAQLMGEKRDPAADSKSLGALIDGMDRMTEGGRAAAYPQAAALAKRVYPDLPLAPEYDPKQWAEISPLGKALRGEKAPEGFTLGQNQVRFGPDGQPIAQGPAEAPKPEAGFTLGAGEVRYGPDGKPIASRPPKPDSPSAEPLTAIMGPDGNPVLVPRSQAVGKRPASTREQGRSVTSGDAGRIADLDTSLDDLNKLSGAVGKATGTAAKIGAAVPNFVTEWTGFGADAKSKQATIDRVKQVIGKALEGGVLRKEDEYKYEKILPTIGDVPEVVQAKLDGLWKAIQLRKQTTLDSLADAGYDTGKFAARAPRERETGGAPNAAPIVQRNTDTGAYRHSLDGGKTWKAGQP
jgi:hypothetical protein